MRAFISHAHGAILAACTAREEMAKSLSRVESYSHSLEDQVASLHEKISDLRLDLERRR